MERINQIIADGAGARMRTAEKIKEDTRALNDDIDTLNDLRREYRADIRAIKWWNWRWCSASMMVIVLCSWFFFHVYYKERLNEAKDVIVQQVGENQAVLSTLAKANRRIELGTHDNGNKLLIIRNSKGWTTFEKHGVIEFK